MMKRIIKMMAIIPAIAVFAMVFAACEEESTSPVRAEKVTLDRSTLDLFVDGTYSLSATIEPSNTVDNAVEWLSLNPAVAEVDASGVVTAKSVGTTKVVATTYNRQTGVCVVNVHVPLTGIILSTTKVDMEVDDSKTVTATIAPGNATDVVYEWKVESSAEGVVSYTTDGASITLKGTGVGTAVVSVTSRGISSANVNVSVYVTANNVLKNAAGYWEFDDDADFGKPTYGTISLDACTCSVKRTDGPSATNKAVIGEHHKNDISWEHPWFKEGTPPDSYTVMWDLRLPRVTAYYGGLWCSHNANQLVYRFRNTNGNGERVQIGSGGMTYIGSPETYPTGTEEYTPWIRLIAVFDREAIDGKQVRRFTAYFDGATGVDINNNSPLASVTLDDPRFDIRAGHKLWFLSDTEADESARNDDSPHPLSALAFWDRALTIDEITLLGGVK
jgi:uncharacterized protein YjdB